MVDGTWVAEIDVPTGSWRYWPSDGVAIWVGARKDAIPRVEAVASLDLFDAVAALASAGLALRELSFRFADGWTANIRAHRALDLLADSGDFEGISGVWADPAGRAVRATVYKTGVVTAEDRDQAWRIAEALRELAR
jgi:hypothetical protein